MKGKLAESWELDPSGKRAVFKLREGVKSNWGNELTAEDVKWTWDRKFGLGGARRLLYQRDRPQAARGRPGRGQVRRLLQRRRAEPAAAQDPGQSLLPDLRLRPSARRWAARDDPWATQVHRERERRLRALPARPADARPAGRVPGARRLLGRQAGDRHGGVPGGADLGGARPAPARRRRRHRPISAAARDHRSAEGAERRGRDGAGLVHDLDRAQRQDAALRQRRRAPGDELRLPAGAGAARPIYPESRKPAERLHAEHLSGLSWSTSRTATTRHRQRSCSQQAGLGGGFQTTLSYNAGDPVQEPIAILYQSALREVGVDLQLRKVPAGTVLQLRLRARSADDLLCRQPVVPRSGLLDAALLRQRQLRELQQLLPTPRSTSCWPKPHRPRTSRRGST